MAAQLRPTLTRLCVWIAHPAAFVLVLCFVVAWMVFDIKTLEWHAVATVLTLFMTLFIQRAEHRDTQALHAKLDELLRVEGKARNELVQLDTQEPEVIEKHRDETNRNLDR
jgi:low affinity Fe/Cu permease